MTISARPGDRLGVHSPRPTPSVWAAMLRERDRQTLEDRADRQRELRLAGGAGGAGLVAHQQVRRGPAGQALLRWLRVRGRRRAARRGARPGPLPGRRARQRPAPLGRPGQHGRLPLGARARRPHPGHEPRPRRPPDPRLARQLQRQAGSRSTPTASARTTSASTTTPSSARPPRSARRSSWRAPAPIRASSTSSAWRAIAHDVGRAAVRRHGAHRGPRRGRACIPARSRTRTSSRRPPTRRCAARVAGSCSVAPSLGKADRQGGLPGHRRAGR